MALHRQNLKARYNAVQQLCFQPELHIFIDAQELVSIFVLHWSHSRVLGDVVKVARGRVGLTQAEVAASIDRDSRTILNIENYKGNPKLEVLYPLVRTLKIDAREIFNPGMQLDSPALRQLRFMVDDCSEEKLLQSFRYFKLL